MSAPIQLTMGGLAEHRTPHFFSDHCWDRLLPDDPHCMTPLPQAGVFIAYVKMLVAKVMGLSDLVRVYRAHAPA